MNEEQQAREAWVAVSIWVEGSAFDLDRGTDIEASTIPIRMPPTGLIEYVPAAERDTLAENLRVLREAALAFLADNPVGYKWETYRALREAIEGAE